LLRVYFLLLHRTETVAGGGVFKRTWHFLVAAVVKSGLAATLSDQMLTSQFMLQPDAALYCSRIAVAAGIQQLQQPTLQTVLPRYWWRKICWSKLP
jgi:hypothetical protein